MAGKVYIVGAGPGAADLLTLRAVSVLRAADIVLHDDLVSGEVLRLCSSTAEMINVGKRCGDRTRTQQEINDLMVTLAQDRRIIVRLKSGDPAIFGRLGEELDALREAGARFEIVPGITAAAAAAASAGITLTDRRAASALVLMTAHNAGNEFPGRLNPGRSTFAVYMPGPDYASTARELVEMGLDPDTPCTVVSNAGRPAQRVCLISLFDLPFVIGISSPALLIVGEVARGAEFLSPEQSEGPLLPLTSRAVARDPASARD